MISSAPPAVPPFAAAPSARSRPPGPRGWWLTAGLLLLTAVPVAAGVSRILRLAGGGPVTAGDARFFASPLPVVVHILAACVYAVAGAFQFTPALRRRRPRWHRIAGRILVPCGLAAALSGLWMTAFYPNGPGDGTVLAGLRLLFGSAMAAALVLGAAAVRRRDVARHRVWMVRGYAVGMGAGTQVLTQLPWLLLVGPPGVGARAVLMGAGWAINLAVAETTLRRRPFGARPAPSRVSGRPALRRRAAGPRG